MKSTLNALERFKKGKLVKNKTTWILKKTYCFVLSLSSFSTLKKHKLEISGGVLCVWFSEKNEIKFPSLNYTQTKDFAFISEN